MNNLLAATGNVGQIILIAAVLVVFIGFFIWQSISNRKKQKEATDRVNALKVGDRVKTIGGVCGFVAEINNEENTFVLETGMEGKKSYVKFDKGAIYQTAPAEGAAYAKPEDKKEENAEPAAEEVKAEETTADTLAEDKAAKKAARRKKHEDDVL